MTDQIYLDHVCDGVTRGRVASEIDRFAPTELLVWETPALVLIADAGFALLGPLDHQDLTLVNYEYLEQTDLGWNICGRFTAIQKDLDVRPGLELFWSTPFGPVEMHSQRCRAKNVAPSVGWWSTTRSSRLE